MNQLYDVMYDFDFSLPPDYALVIRALGSLEGTAKTLDPDFKVVESAYPFVIGRLLADPHPDMRKILRELIIRNNGSIRWNRLERLVHSFNFQWEYIFMCLINLSMLLQHICVMNWLFSRTSLPGLQFKFQLLFLLKLFSFQEYTIFPCRLYLVEFTYIVSN